MLGCLQVWFVCALIYFCMATLWSIAVFISIVWGKCEGSTHLTVNKCWPSRKYNRDSYFWNSVSSAAWIVRSYVLECFLHQIVWVINLESWHICIIMIYTMCKSMHYVGMIMSAMRHWWVPLPHCGNTSAIQTLPHLDSTHARAHVAIVMTSLRVAWLKQVRAAAFDMYAPTVGVKSLQAYNLCVLALMHEW